MSIRDLAAHAKRVRDTGAVRVSITAHASGDVLAAHWHERPYFCFVLRGSFDEDATRCGVGATVFHPAGDEHVDAFRAPTQCLNVELHDGWIEERGVRAFTTRELRANDRLVDLGHRIDGELRLRDEASALAIEGLALEIAAEWMRGASAAQPQWLLDAESIVAAEFRNRVSLRDVALRVGVSPAQLARAFRSSHRMTMRERVLRLRVEYARERIEQSREPLAAIACDAGFSDQSHLAKVFRRFTGVTCSAARANANQSLRPVQDAN